MADEKKVKDQAKKPNFFVRIWRKLGKLCKALNEIYHRLDLFANDLACGIYEDIRNVVVACADACDEAVELGRTVEIVLVNVNESAAIIYVIAKLDTLLNANDAALGFGNSLVDKVDKILGFSGAFYSSDKFNHFIPPGFRGLQYYYTIIN